MPENSRFFVISILFVICLVTAWSNTLAQEPAVDDTVKAIVALKCNCGIKIDGIIDEEVWELAPRSNERFHSRIAETNRAPIPVGVRSDRVR